MPFYFRVPLPGPFGYSHRIGGHKRKRSRTARVRGPQTSHRMVSLSDEAMARMREIIWAPGSEMTWDKFWAMSYRKQKRWVHEHTDCVIR